MMFSLGFFCGGAVCAFLGRLRARSRDRQLQADLSQALLFTSFRSKTSTPKGPQP